MLLTSPCATSEWQIFAISAPLSAELIAAWLDDEALPLPRAVAEACHPSRFLLRELIRGR